MFADQARIIIRSGRGVEHSAKFSVPLSQHITRAFVNVDTHNRISVKIEREIP